MDEKNNHLEDLKEVRSLMEKSSSFLSLSGLSGASAGVVGIIAAVYLIDLIPAKLLENTVISDSLVKKTYTLHLILFAAVTLIITFSLIFFFTYLQSRKKDISLKSGAAKRMTLNLFIPLIAGGIFSLILLLNGYIAILPVVTLLFYGVSLINAGKFTFVEIKYLGFAELLLGLLAAYFITYSLWFWGAGFGLLNILYGIIMYLKYEK